MKATAQIIITNGHKQTARERAELMRWLHEMVSYISTTPTKFAPRFCAEYNKPQKKLGVR